MVAPTLTPQELDALWNATYFPSCFKCGISRLPQDGYLCEHCGWDLRDDPLICPGCDSEGNCEDVGPDGWECQSCMMRFGAAA